VLARWQAENKGQIVLPMNYLSRTKGTAAWRAGSTRISCHAASDLAACAAFHKESRMKLANATKLDRKSGAVPWYFRHQLGAMRTALGGNRDVAQALRAGLGGGRCNHLGFKFVHQGIDWQQDQKVNRGSDDQKRDQGIEKVAVLDNPAVNMQQQEREVRLADDRRYEWVDDVGHQSVDDRAKCGADHNGYGKIDHIAAQDEIAKSFNHYFSPEWEGICLAGLPEDSTSA
jgi:hypothetical protein